MLKFLIALLALSLAIPAAHARESIIVAAAADLVYCVPELNAAFNKQFPEVELTVTNGSSGMFFNQIRNGAPIDVFMSADMSFPRKLAQEGSVDGNSLTMYAIGRIVLWTTEPKLNVDSGLTILKDAKVHKIALANPDVFIFRMGTNQGQ